MKSLNLHARKGNAVKYFETVKTACFGIVACSLQEKQPELRESTTNLYREQCLQIPYGAASPGGRRLLSKIRLFGRICGSAADKTPTSLLVGVLAESTQWPGDAGCRLKRYSFFCPPMPYKTFQPSTTHQPPWFSPQILRKSPKFFTALPQGAGLPKRFVNNREKCW
jgi:hypothetical protein